MNDHSRSGPAVAEDVSALLSDLHAEPELRNWVTVGSVALPPVPEPRIPDDLGKLDKSEPDWTIWSLLAYPVRMNTARLTYRPAWGAVQWRWPSRRVRQRLRLPSAMIASGAVGVWATRPDGDVAELRQILFDRLGRVLADPPPGDPETLRQLSGAYRGLLPAGAYAAYHSLAPGTAGWLAPE